MKKSLAKPIVYVFSLSFLLLGSLYANNADHVDWKRYSQNLVTALKSDNAGLQRAAMMQVIKYSDYLDIEDAAGAVAQVFINHKEHRMRQLAFITLTKMHGDWVREILVQQMLVEKDPAIFRQLVVFAHNNQMISAALPSTIAPEQIWQFRKKVTALSNTAAISQ